MAFNIELIPGRWGKRSVPVRREDAWSTYPGRDELTSVFDEFFRGLPAWPTLLETTSAGFRPTVDLTETESEIKISAELPGLTEKDIDLTLANDSLTIKGEKNEEKEDRTHGYYRAERHYGAFQRTIPFPCEIDSEKVDATFKNGVLTITLPKSAKVQNAVKKVEIKQG
jgi:HSP20 family protein